MPTVVAVSAIEATIAAVSTHDLPTIAGLWTGADLSVQKRLGSPVAERHYQHMRQRLLRVTGVEEDAPLDAIIVKAHEALAQSPSMVLIATLHDALAIKERPNMPGTVEQWPNWSIALPVPIEQIESAALPAAIARRLPRDKQAEHGADSTQSADHVPPPVSLDVPSC